MALPWVHFFLSAAVVVWAGNRLAKSAAIIIADHTGFGTAWAGVPVLPLDASQSELGTSICPVFIDPPLLIEPGASRSDRPAPSIASAVTPYFISAVLMVFLLADSAGRVAVEWRLGCTSVGFLFGAASTAPSETVISLSAVRLEFLDNIFGAILFWTDFFYLPASIFLLFPKQSVCD